MSHVTTLILLGVLVGIAPFAGLPISWLSWILPILGLCVIASGLSLRQSRVRAEMRASAAAPAPAPAPELGEVIEVEISSVG